MKKLIIVIIVLAVAGYFIYKWYAKRKAEAAAAAAKPKVVEIKEKTTGLSVVSDLSNGLNADLVRVA